MLWRKLLNLLRKVLPGGRAKLKAKPEAKPKSKHRREIAAEDNFNDWSLPPKWKECPSTGIPGCFPNEKQLQLEKMFANEEKDPAKREARLKKINKQEQDRINVWKEEEEMDRNNTRVDFADLPEEKRRAMAMDLAKNDPTLDVEQLIGDNGFHYQTALMEELMLGDQRPAHERTKHVCKK